MQLPSSGRLCNGWKFFKTYIGQAAGGEVDLVVLIGVVQERAAIRLKMRTG
jgi:hypothetical protein